MLPAARCTMPSPSAPAAYFLSFCVLLVLAGCTQLPATGQPDGTGIQPPVPECRFDGPEYAAGIGTDTTLLAGFQDEVLGCMEANRTIDAGRALALLDSFQLSSSTGIPALDSMNPVHSNNLAIRSELLRMLLLQHQDASYQPDFGPVMEKTGEYGFWSGGYMTWYEGSGYLVYTLAAVREANRHFDSPDLRAFQEGGERWLRDFALPDGTLAPIGDTALGSSYAPENRQARIVYTSHETAITFDNGTGYLLFRHPVANLAPASPIRNDLHTQFDFGSVWLWYDGSWRLRPVGYPDYALKTSEGLDDKFSYNIQSADRIGQDFTPADFNRLDFARYLGSWRAKTAATLPEGAVQRNEYVDRYELVFSHSLNTGEGGAYENYSRKITLYKGQKRLDITDSNPAALSSYLLVSDDATVTPLPVAGPVLSVSCGYDGKWSPAWGVVEKSRRCSVGKGQAVAYSVEWQ